MEEQFELLNKSPLKNNKNINSQLEDDEWIILNETISSPFYTGNFNGNDELEAVQVSELLLNSPKNNNKTQIVNEPLSIQQVDEQQIYCVEKSKPYESLILTPEFLITLNVFTNNMNWISKEVAVKCVQSSQITTNKIISISQIIKNQCKQIANITTANSYMNYGVQI